MMPTAKGMSQMIPNHVLRVGQTIRLDPVQDPVTQHSSLTESSSHCEDPDLEISLENLNQLILELDPTFEPIPVKKSPTSISPPPDSLCLDGPDDIFHGILISRGCSTRSLPTMEPSISPSIPIPTHSNVSCSPQGTLVFSCSPTSSLPPLPFGSAPRRNPSSKHNFSQGSLRLSHSNRNSATSLLSTSTCSDTSYILGSNLSLAGDDADFPDSIPPSTPGAVSDGFRTQPFNSRPSFTKQDHLREPSKGAWSSPASLCGSQTDIPLLLINGAPEPAPAADLIQNIPASPSKKKCSSFQAYFGGSLPSMKFVMDTSKFWFRPHISRTEAEALLKDKEAGTFVVRDSTSFRGSFGLAMKVNQSPTNFTASAYPGESSSDLIRHFLIESSAKGVRVRGSSQEPYFGSLSALVYQHTISAYALPCRLLLHSQDLDSAEERANEQTASEDTSTTACNFVYLNAVPMEMLTGPCAVQRAVSLTLEKAPASFAPTIVNLKVSPKGVTLTDINRKLFFRRHYPAHLLSYSGEDPDSRLWRRGSSFGARMFAFVAKGVEASMENMCHVFAEYDPLQPCSKVAEFIQAAIVKP